VDTEAI